MHDSSNLDYKKLFEATPTLYMVVNKDLTIAAVSDSFLTGTFTVRENILGEKVDIVFPDNPLDAYSRNSSYLTRTLEEVFIYGKPLEINTLKYDIPHPDGGFEEKFWHNINIPVYNDQGQVQWVLHVTEDITENIRHRQNEIKWMNQLSESNVQAEELRLLSRHLHIVREEERAKIAREIHDGLGQQLSVLKMDMNWISKRFMDMDEVARNKMEDINRLLLEMVGMVRRVSAELRPSLLDDMGLLAAIEWQLNEIETRSGITVHLQNLAEEPPINSNLKLNLFRILQESITNVIRHAKASNIWVHLQMFDNGSLELTVKDDGIGFNTDEKGKINFGLLSMKERTMMIGGKYEVRSTPSKGTLVSVIVDSTAH